MSRAQLTWMAGLIVLAVMVNILLILGASGKRSVLQPRQVLPINFNRCILIGRLITDIMVLRPSP
jgi:hypothetical protein